MLNVRPNTTFEIKTIPGTSSFIVNRRQDIFSEVSRVTQMIENGFIAKVSAFEGRTIGIKGNLRAGQIAFPDNFKLCLRDTQRVFLLINIAVLINFDNQTARQSVYYTDPNTVKTARYFVAAAAKFTTRVQNG